VLCWHLPEGTEESDKRPVRNVGVPVPPQYESVRVTPRAIFCDAVAWQVVTRISEGPSG
jgi:hypothetical protein